MEEFDVLNNQDPLKGTIFLEASAGTGKTFAIEHSVRRLILSGIPLDKILITTFTRAGVRDLKKRIFSNLQEAYDQKIGDLLIIQNALSLIDEAGIYTIHSFCYKMLAEFAFEGNVDLRLGSPENAIQIDLLERNILDTLRTTLESSEFSPAELRRLMQPFMRQISKFTKKMVAFLLQEPKIQAPYTYRDIKEEFEKRLSSFPAASLKSELLKHLPFFKGTTNKDKEIHPFITSQIEALINLDLETLIQAPKSLFSMISPENMKANASFSFNESKALSLLKSFQPFFAHSYDPNLLFLRMAKKIEGRRDKKGEASPNFLLEQMLISIEYPLFRQLVSKKYEAVIIDEFQDTDPLQWEIFKKLYFNKTSLFLVVGDPKQSIYAFRGADLPTFLRAKELFSKKYRLSTNYRSSPILIDHINALFKDKGGSFPYYHVHSGVSQEVKGSTTLAITKSAKKRSNLWPTEEDEKLFFSFIAKEILKRCKEGFSYSDAAILVKDRFQAARALKFLKEVNIPSISNSTESLAESNSFSFLEIACKLLYHPRSISLIKQILLHPFVGWPYEKLLADIDDPDFLNVMNNIMHLRMAFLENGVSSFLRELENVDFGGATLLEALVEKGEDYFDFITLSELLLQSEKDPLYEEFESLKEKNADNDPEVRRKQIGGEDSVLIMTSHMSKGLEFPIVFALGASTRSSSKKSFIKTDTGEVAPFSKEDPKVEKALESLDQEKMRLLYVAVTRAKNHNYLFYPIDTEKSPIALGEHSPFELLLETLEEEPLNFFESIGIEIELVKETFITKIENPDPPKLCEATPVKRLEKDPPFLSFSSLPTPHQEKSEKVDAKDTEIPPGAETGTIVHLLFEKIIEDALFVNWERETINNFIERELFSTSIYQWKGEIYDILYAAFHTPLKDGFSLVDVSPNEMIQELRFAYPRMKGFADLVFSFKEKFYIVDWKMNLLSDYSREEIEKTMTNNNYYMQATIYKEGLKKYLESIYEDPFEDLFGGSFYFFLRGKEKGLYYFIPEGELCLS